MIRALVCALFLAGPALATQDGWPALYDVSNVAMDDVLNLRRAPDASAEVIGTLAHDAKDVEVIRPNEAGTWGFVNIGETGGWVSLAFLSRHVGQHDGAYPEIATCHGTEPFWAMNREGGIATLEVFLTDRPPLSQAILWETGTANHRRRYSFGTANMVGVLSRQYCDDGMSDMEFGLELNLILPGEGLHLQGCCSLQPRAE